MYYVLIFGIYFLIYNYGVCLLCDALVLLTLCWRVWQFLSCITMVDALNRWICCPIVISDWDLKISWKSLFIITSNWYFNVYLQIIFFPIMC